MVDRIFRFFREVRNFFLDFRQGIRNIRKWLPVIWRDRDFDYVYLYDVLEFKIRNMADYTQRSQLTQSWEENAEKMERCVELIDKIRNESFHDEEREKHAEKWGEFELDTSSIFGMFNSKRPNVITEEDKALENKEFYEWMEEARRRSDAAKRELFDILNDEIEGWWD